MTPSEVARAFVDRINARDVDRIAALMTEDHAREILARRKQ